MKRFAIYYTPAEDSPLSRIASSWLGRDPFSPNGAIPDASRNGFSKEIWRAATSDPRLYGFHATLKPPFRLEPYAREQELLDRLHAFARRQTRFHVAPLSVSTISSFLALTLSAPSPALEELAARCVREFDDLRAPATEEDLARRRRSRLTDKQLQYLSEWGYPYVMDEWQFHMTLTSSLADAALLAQFQTHLKDLFEPHCHIPQLIDSVCLFEQPGPGETFHVAERFHFA